jgi:sterol desaturase/sphingolipid hydroxylase (fatty acid hydroxylase superfamily)
MEFDLDTGKLVVFIAGLALFLWLETLAPARPWRRARWRRIGFHGAIAAVNTVIVRLLVYVPLLLWIVHVEQQGWGVSRWLGLTGWTEILLSVMVLDAFDYFWHRANHRVPLLWRFHKAHHADTEMDVTTALRFHPGELVLSGFAKAVWVAIWGPTAVAWFVFEALVSLCAQFHHANIDFPDRVERVLSKVLVTPRFHATHHVVDRRWGDRNFSTILSIWDPLFGTPVRDGPAPLDEPDALGLPEGRSRAFSPGAWLVEPLASRNVALARRRRPPTTGAEPV